MDTLPTRILGGRFCRSFLDSLARSLLRRGALVGSIREGDLAAGILAHV